MIESTKQSDGSLTLRVKGRSTSVCYKQFNDAVAGPPAPHYVVDLRAPSYMDSSALACSCSCATRSAKTRAG